MKKTRKKRVAVAAASGCRACEMGLLDLHYLIGPLDRWLEIVYWPYVLGSTHEDLIRMEEVDVCIFTGALQTVKDRESAAVLREKSELLVACGACSAFGGLPGLANLTSGTPSSSEPDPGLPDLPGLESRVTALTQAVRVDYIVPGCPPTQNLLWAALQSLAGLGRPPARLSFAAARLPEAAAQAVTSGVLPPRGTVFAGEKAVCASCSRRKEEKLFEAYKRPFQNFEESGRCLLEQGLICLGITTREGCGGLCPGVGVPCRGCFGKAEAVYDPGAKMVSSVSSTFKATDKNQIEQLVEEFVDLSGTFYRYTLPTQCALLTLPSEEQDDQGLDYRTVALAGRTGTPGGASE